MGSRLELHHKLVEILGSNNVYFQPPASLTMTYPCIVYEREYGRTEFADNAPYTHTKRYSVTYISRNPDDPVPDKIAMLPMCLFSRFYTADNLNHTIHNLYF